MEFWQVLGRARRHRFAAVQTPDHPGLTRNHPGSRKCLESEVGLGRFVMAHRTLLVGIDSGTQSTKALVVEARTGKVLAEGTAKYDLIPNLPPGAKEQHPRTWVQAATKAVKTALKAARASDSEVV